MKKKIKIPKIGQKIKFPDKNPDKMGERIMEGKVVRLLNRFEGLAVVNKVTSKSEFIINIKNIIWE